ITATNGLFPFFSAILFSLVQREPTLAVKCIKTFSLDEIETRVSNTTEQRHHLCMCDFPAVRLRQEPAAPVVRTKSFLVSVGPDLHAAITDHGEFDAVAVDFTERVAEIVGRAFGPVEENVNTDEFFLRRLPAGGAHMRLLALAILLRLQNLWRLAQPLDNGVS